MTTRFSASEIDGFDRDGFVPVRGLFTAGEAAAQAEWIDEIAHRTPTPGREMVYFEDSLTGQGRRVLSRIEKLAEFHEGLARVVFDDRITGSVAQLLGEPAVLFKEKFNLKLPEGGGFVPHQSKPNLTAEPRRNVYLTYNRRSDGDHRERYFAEKRKNYPPDCEREPGREYVFKVWR